MKSRPTRSCARVRALDVHFLYGPSNVPRTRVQRCSASPTAVLRQEHTSVSSPLSRLTNSSCSEVSRHTPRTLVCGQSARCCGAVPFNGLDKNSERVHTGLCGTNLKSSVLIVQSWRIPRRALQRTQRYSPLQETGCSEFVSLWLRHSSKSG